MDCYYIISSYHPLFAFSMSLSHLEGFAIPPYDVFQHHLVVSSNFLQKYVDFNFMTFE